MFRSKAVLVLSLVLIGGCVFAGVVIWAPKEAPPAPAAFQIADLVISPAEVKPGEKVTITAEVTNAGGTDGSYTAKLRINDVTEATRKVTVAAGASQLLSFTVVKDAPDTYKVSWDELSGQFGVVKPAPPKPAPPKPAPPKPAPPKPAPPKPAPPEPTVRTWTLTDDAATRLLVKGISGASAHFVPEDKIELRYSVIFKLTCAVGVSEGKLWLEDIPFWLYDNWLINIIGGYTSYSGGKLFLTSLPPWFDPTEEIAPDVTELPAFKSITTEEGKAILTY